MKESIIQDIIKISQQLSKSPISSKDYRKHGKHSIETVKKYMGSWPQAVKEIFNTTTLQKLPKIKIYINCKNCGRETYNPKFCSSSCTMVYLNKNENGRKVGRKSKGNKCTVCQISIPPRRKRCSKCKFMVKVKEIRDKINYKHILETTIQDVLTNDTQKYRRIRNHARAIAKESNLLNKCEVCQYDKHVECAHITPIKKFPKNTLIKMVNDPKNLKGLCPNCHWEFDNLP
jgi:hypothetical protein